MSVRDLAEQFVAAMDRLVGRMSLERWADWLVLATQLVLLRSRLLFPISPEAASEADQEPRIEVRRLEEMVFMRAAASWLTTRPRLGIDVFSRSATMVPFREGGYVALTEACLVVLRGRGGRPEEVLIYRQVYRTFDGFQTPWRGSARHWRINRMGGDLTLFRPGISIEAVNRGLRARAAVASTLLAGLELAREGALAIEQESHCGPMSFVKRQRASDQRHHGRVMNLQN